MHPLTLTSPDLQVPLEAPAPATFQGSGCMEAPEQHVALRCGCSHVGPDSDLAPQALAPTLILILRPAICVRLCCLCWY